MIRLVQVKYGAPIVRLKYRTIQAISISLQLGCFIADAYLLYVLDYATETSQTLGRYIDLISNDGYVLSTLISLPTLFCLLVNTGLMPVAYQAFGSIKPKNRLNCWLFVFLILQLAGIILFLMLSVAVLTHAYEDNEDLHDGILDAMQNYSQDSLTKSNMDRLQIKLQCCGSKDYTEWFNITWYDVNLVKNETEIKGETPFSCCSIKSVYPCIHHGIVSGISSNYFYKQDTNLSISKTGCHSVIIKTKTSVAWNIIWKFTIAIILQAGITVLLRFMQTARIERERFDKEGHIYTSWLIGCYDGFKRVYKDAPLPPPIPPELMEIRRRREAENLG